MDAISASEAVAVGNAEPGAAEMGFWEQLRSPELAAQERLFFEVYGQSPQGRAWARPLLDVLATGNVDSVDAAARCFAEMTLAYVAAHSGATAGVGGTTAATDPPRR
jgi:hypothetical protein